MHVVFLNTNQMKGGAAIAAHRYFNAYLNTGANVSYAFVHAVAPGEHMVDLRHSFFLKKVVKYLLKFERKLTRKRKIPGEGYWSVSRWPRFYLRKIKRLKPDIINLHWINDDFLSVGEIAKLGVPLVWTFHDVWAVTGGCHYPGDCQGFTTGCGNCPKLIIPGRYDWSRHLWRQKYKKWKHLDITIVCPSHWMAQMVKQSRLFGDKRIEVLPYSVEPEIFKPIDSSPVREKLNIKPRQKVLLFGAVNSLNDRRKGAWLLVDALKKLKERVPPDDLVFLVFGAEESPTLSEVPFRVINLGFINDKRELANYYAASTAYVLPSVEDNLPNTVLESLACGTPVVAFDIGGVSDMVEHNKNGFLVERADTSLLANALEKLIKLPDADYETMRKAALAKIERDFSQQMVGEKQRALFESIMQKRV